MRVNPYLGFNGQCEAAFKFYEQCLGGKIVAMMTAGDSPVADHMPAEKQGAILHACLAVGDTVLMGSDCMCDHYETPKSFSVSLQLDHPAEAERVFHALSENGTIQMPIEQTFWSARFGMLVDQFGIPWMVNCEKAA